MKKKELLKMSDNKEVSNECQDYITFDEIPYEINDNIVKIKAHTIYKPMFRYIEEGDIDLVSIAQYDDYTFDLYIESLNNVYNNRLKFNVNLLLKNSSLMVRNLINNIRYNIEESKPLLINGYAFNISKICDEVVSMLTLDNMVFIYSEIKKNNNNELLEIISMHYASTLYNNIKISCDDSSMIDITEKLYGLMSDMIMILSQDFIDMIYDICMKEPLVELYMKILYMRNEIKK